jgi:hypothetical protein
MIKYPLETASCQAAAENFSERKMDQGFSEKEASERVRGNVDRSLAQTRRCLTL